MWIIEHRTWWRFDPPSADREALSSYLYLTRSSRQLLVHGFVRIDKNENFKEKVEFLIKQ